MSEPSHSEHLKRGRPTERTETKKLKRHRGRPRSSKFKELLRRERATTRRR